MSEKEAIECPKCGGEMEIGYLRDAPYWRRGANLLRIGLGKRIFGYRCKNCGYVEFYTRKRNKKG